MTVTPIKNPQNTRTDRGGVRLTVSGSDDTKQFALQLNGQDAGSLSGPGGTKDFSDQAAGAISFTVTPLTRFDVPNIGGGSGAGEATRKDGTVIGAPVLGSVSLASTGDTSAHVSYSGSGAQASEAVTASYSIGKNPIQGPKNCFTDGQSSPDFDGLRKYSFVSAMACLRSDYGMSSGTSGSVFIGRQLQAPQVTYTIANAPTAAGDGVIYDLLKNPDGTPKLDVQGKEADTKLIYSNTGTEELSLDPASAAEFGVKQCYGDAPCSDERTVGWRNAPTIVTAKPNGQCLPLTNGSVGNPSSDELKTRLTISAAAAPEATAKAGTPANGLVPVTITWGGSFQPLQQATLNVCTTP
ncbi:hypothetical protein AB3K78_15880 [Leucobacter sp. HNU]|uniref:hypothetical protein n=1 Tax=Leucobacter sp. HNU TaxID=3236805 RepID=UPI003A807585